MVIFGAGASYDSAPYHPAPGGSAPGRPPLADELFDNRGEFAHAKNLYPQIRPVIPSLISRSGKTVEQVLQALRDDAVAYPRGFQQLTAIRYYLQMMLAMVEQAWFINAAQGVTNQLTLLDQIEKYYKGAEPICLVTFNYDTLIERALETFGIQFGHIADFIATPKFKLFKLHGSVTWARRITTRIGAGIDTGDPMQVARQVIQQTSLDVSAEYEMNATPSQPPPFIQHFASYPAIAIPVEKKAEFECPAEHVESLKKQIPKTTKIVTIGWRGTEDHFLKLLGTLLPVGVDVVACSGSEAQADQTLNQLSAIPIKGSYHALAGGFTQMIARNEIVDFLRGA
jgi:hypothetical protein